MNLFKKKYNFIYFISLFMPFETVIADQCPTAEIIKERKISRDYEWTIDERRSLDDVLAVEKLYSVRIKNNGEFVACYYSGGKNLLRLDGSSIERGCTINNKSGLWELAENGEKLCKDEDLNLCHYEIDCQESSEGKD